MVNSLSPSLSFEVPMTVIVSASMMCRAGPDSQRTCSHAFLRAAASGITVIAQFTPMV
jgi:hypothetical protein